MWPYASIKVFFTPTGSLTGVLAVEDDLPKENMLNPPDFWVYKCSKMLARENHSTYAEHARLFFQEPGQGDWLNSIQSQWHSLLFLVRLRGLLIGTYIQVSL